MHNYTLRDRVFAYLSLTKPKIGLMILVCTTIGFFLAQGSLTPSFQLFWALVGTFLSVAGSATLNNFLERDTDAAMTRTKKRALPSGKVSASGALSFGTLLVLGGVGLLVMKVNLLTGFLALLSAFLYVLVYTPLKRVTWLNTFVGAIPGALPPVGGWAAASNEIGIEAAILFLILFIWQHPHFYAIAWMYREDYERGGFQMLPVIDKTGIRTTRQVKIYSYLLLPVSLLPAVIGSCGWIYFIGVTFASVYMVYAGLKFVKNFDDVDARALLHASLFFLPIVLCSVVADSIF